MVEDGADVAQAFDMLLDFVGQTPVVNVRPACRLSANEIYALVRGSQSDLAALARDDTHYKHLIAQATSTPDKLALAQRLAIHRLASGVLPELDACFAALGLEELQAAGRVLESMS